MKHVYLIFASILLLSACNSNQKKAESNLVSHTKVSDSTNIIPPKENDVEVKNWLDDFKNFREALHLKDLKKLKTYFDFPVSDDGTSIWSLCNLTAAEIQVRKNKFKNSDLFYEQDLEQYHTRIFNADFVKMLLKIKSDKLYATHFNETPEVTTADHIYKLIAEYNPTSKILSFNLAYANNETDEEGNRVSEGEYNVIYSFTVIDGKYLKFKRIDIAG